MDYTEEKIQELKKHIQGYEQRIQTLQNELTIHQNNVNYTQLLINNEILNVNSLSGIISDYNILQYQETKQLFSIFDKNEVLIVIRNMDKTDYNHQTYRFIDIKKIMNDISIIKTYYPNWKLINMTHIPDKTGTYPPYNKYMYSFLDYAKTQQVHPHLQNITISIGPL
jgi:hypothetical protein